MWLTYYEKGFSTRELNQNIDPLLVVSMFRSLYYGDSFIQSITGNELDIDELKKKYLLLYNSIRL